MDQAVVQCEHSRLADVDSLTPHPKNPNTHSTEQIQRLAEIIEYQGFRHPIIVSKRSGFIAAGHGRLAAAKLLGMREVPVDEQDFESDDAEYAFLVSDNAIAEWATLDLAAVNLEVPALGPDFDIDLLGIKDFTIDVADKNDADPDAVPEPPKVAKTKRGELWLLGEHRLLIGDCTESTDVQRLMAGESVDIVFTDPPYNVGFQYNLHDDTKIDYEKWRDTCATWLAEWSKLAGRIILTPGGNNLELWCRIANPTHVCCWVKENANTTGRVTHLWQWEPIVVIGKFKRRRASDVFVHHVDSGFLRDETTGCHPCPKPLRLWDDMLDAFSEPGEVVFEPFCGSGTTVIAGEKLKRRVRAMEIDPVYCDVILQRFADYAGIDPVREDGVKWSELQ